MGSLKKANACDAPNVLIALDRSGSMSLSIAQRFGIGARIPGAFMTRAEVAEQAIRRMVERFSNRARFGLAMFLSRGPIANLARDPWLDVSCAGHFL